MENKSKKRLAIYVHYDPKGEVRDYVLYCLNGLKDVVSEIIVVVNGELSEDGRHKLDSAGVELHVRENKDFDFGAWKAAIEYIGYDNIAQYDELLLTNNSYYGPIYPFSEMWNAMDTVTCDFWGVNMHPGMEASISRHIQSYWMVFRKKILTSDIWRKYWVNLPSFENLWDVIFKCEVKLTGYFVDNGFKPATYMSLEKYDRLIHENPTIISDIQVMEDKCPIVKRKFFFGYNGILSPAGDLLMGFHIKRLMDFLEKDMPEFADIIWDDLLKTQHLSTLDDHLNLNFILSSTLSPKRKIVSSKAAVIIYIYYEDMVEYCRIYSRAIPEYVDIVIVYISESVRKKCEEVFSDRANRLIYRIQPNRGRDNAAFLVTCKDIFKQYDFVCFVHAKKSPHFAEGALLGTDFREHCFLSLLYSAPFVENVFEVFKDNPRLGFLVPFTVAGGNFYVIADEWIGNYKNAKMILKQYFDIEEDYLDPHPLAPFGGMFWARTKALETLMGYNWQYEDFPEEPIPKTDGLLAHAIERLMPRLVQNDGFYTAFVAPDKYASSYVGHMYYMNREMKVRLFGMIGARRDMELLREMETLNNHVGDVGFWQKHRFLLEIKYTYYKLFRKIVMGDLRQYYKDNWMRLKATRRLVRKNG